MVNSNISMTPPYFSSVKPQSDAPTKKRETVDLTVLAKGAVKTVWIATEILQKESVTKTTPTEVVSVARDKIGPYTESVYYTARQGWVGDQVNELRREADIRKILKQKLSEEQSAHLDVEMEEVSGQGRIEGRSTFRVGKAEEDFEKFLRKNDILPVTIDMGREFLHALTFLHRAGFNYNDIKPENCLIFRRKDGSFFLKLSDFGKADVPSVAKTGNTRFAGPSGGDVYGAGMVLIRNFEERYLNEKESLIDGNKSLLQRSAKSGLRGIEKYVVEDKAFIIANNPGAWSRSRSNQGKYTEAQKQVQDKAMFKYIDALIKAMEDSGDFTLRQTEDLSALLKLMTKSDSPLTSKEALEAYNMIFPEPTAPTTEPITEGVDTEATPTPEAPLTTETTETAETPQTTQTSKMGVQEEDDGSGLKMLE